MSSNDYWMGQALGEAIGRGAEVKQWVEYAKKLEQAIISLRKGDQAHRALERALIAELKPNSPLARKEVRQATFNTAFQNARATVSGD